MKFIVSSTSLLKQLQSIGGVLNSSNTLPILDHFLFEVKEQELVASASDLETVMITRIHLEKGDATGSVAVPAKLLLDTLKTFPDQPLTFQVDGKTFGIDISLILLFFLQLILHLKKFNKNFIEGRAPGLNCVH